MALDYAKIHQTSRTIIFERFNSRAEDLCTLLKGKDADEALNEVEEKLCVKTFEEFKEKFKPTVYEIFGVDQNGNLQVTYSLEEIHGSNAVSLCDHEFYIAVRDIAMEKSASNSDNNNIDYTKLYEALQPERIYRRAEQRRKDVQQFVTNAIEAQSNGNPDGVRKWMLKAKNTHEAVIEEYSGNALRLLPIAIKDTEKILESKGITKENEDLLESSKDSPKLLPCKPVWNSDGELEFEPLEADVPEAVVIQAQENKVLQITQRNWEESANRITDGNVDKNLFLSVYSEKENSSLINMPAEQLINRKNVLLDMYVTAQQSFCDVVGSLVQKVASLEQFFVHAGDEKGVVENGVIISNCSVSDVLNPENKENVKNFLKVSGNIEKDKIWFAVLPPVVDKNKEWIESTASSDIMSDPYNVFNIGNEEKNIVIETVTAADINNLSEMLAECEILSFFNFNACEQTSFKSFGANSEIIKEYNKELSALKRIDSTVLVYPNFTIIPKSKRQVEVVGGKELYTPSVYINTAYVAAGIVVATQTPKIQKKKFGKRVKDGRPFVRFDLEEEKNNKEFVAKFNPESRLNMDREVAAFIRGKEGNAFCFRSDSLKNNAFVFTARTRDARPIYCFLTKTYLKFLFERTYAQTSDKAKKFATEISNEITNETDSDYINPILYSNEKFEYNDGKFSLEFNSFNNSLGTVEIEVKEIDS